jgi:hypothetical protein
MLNRKSITFVIKEQKSVFIQMHRNSLYWTMPTVLMSTDYDIFKGINFITRKFNWINVKHASIIFNLETEYNGGKIETIFCEILVDSNYLNINELNNSPIISFQRFIPAYRLSMLPNKTVYIKHYLNFIFKKE